MPSAKPRKPKTSDEFIHGVCKTGVLKGGYGSLALSYSMIRGAHDMQQQVAAPAERAALALFMRHAADSLECRRGFLLFRNNLDCPFPIAPADRAELSIATCQNECLNIIRQVAVDLRSYGWNMNYISDALKATIEFIER